MQWMWSPLRLSWPLVCAFLLPAVVGDYLTYDLIPPGFDDLFDQLIIVSTNPAKRLAIVEEIILTFDNTSRHTVLGLDGTDLSNNRSHPLWSVVSPKFLNHFTPRELGYALSHRLAYELVSKKNYSHAVIVEDDILIHRSKFLRAVAEYRPYIKDSWQIIHWWCRCTDSLLRGIPSNRQPLNAIFCKNAVNSSQLTRGNHNPQNC